MAIYHLRAVDAGGGWRSFWGVITMARGGEYNAKWSNKIMRYRIVLQGIALLVFVVILTMASGR